MAQEQRQQTASRSVDDSLYFHKDNVPPDVAPAVRGLLNRGWKCQADNMRLENAVWFAPGARNTAQVVEAHLHGEILRPSSNPRETDAEGNPQAVAHWEQLKMQTGRDAIGAATQPIVQTIITPATRGVSFHEALEIERAHTPATQAARQDGKIRLVPVAAA